MGGAYGAEINKGFCAAPPILTPISCHVERRPSLAVAETSPCAWNSFKQRFFKDPSTQMRGLSKHLRDMYKF